MVNFVLVVDPVAIALLHYFGQTGRLLAIDLRTIHWVHQQVFSLTLDGNLQTLFAMLVDRLALFANQLPSSIQLYLALLEILAFKVEEAKGVLLP